MMDRLEQAGHSRRSSPDPGGDEQATGLPGFGTWRSVYVLVLIVFVVCVILLKAFELAFS
jgi:hypothetical protein